MAVPESVPAWLSKLGNPLGSIPMRKLLRHCVYYPSAGLDGDPVKYLGKHFQSFVYVDYGVGQDAVHNELLNFRGYDLFAHRDVGLCELAPQGEQPPSFLRQDYLDGQVPPIPQPFALWAIYDRKPDFSPEHGPVRFSLLYIGGDGAVTYRSLFYSHNVSPAVVAVIQPGHGFGQNWTNFESSSEIFARLVRRTPSGMPSHLLFGGWGDGEYYRHAPWPEYQTTGLIIHGRLRLFARRTEEQLANAVVNDPDDVVDEFNDVMDVFDDYLDDEFENY